MGATGAVAGCAFDPETGTTSAPAATGTLTVTITNGDTVAHDATLEVRDGTGEVVERSTVTGLARNEMHTFEEGGFDDGRYAVEVLTADRRRQYTWEPRECPELVFEVRIDRGGAVEAEGRCP